MPPTPVQTNSHNNNGSTPIPVDPMIQLATVLTAALTKKDLVLPRYIHTKTDYYQWSNEALKTMYGPKSFRPYMQNKNNILTLCELLSLDLQMDLSIALGKALNQRQNRKPA